MEKSPNNFLGLKIVAFFLYFLLKKVAIVVFNLKIIANICLLVACDNPENDNFN